MTSHRYDRCKAILEEVMKCGDPNVTVLAIVMDELLSEFMEQQSEYHRGWNDAEAEFRGIEVKDGEE